MKKKKNPKRMSLYANLSRKRKTKKDQRIRRRAEYLASLPKDPVKRFFYRLHPKRVLGFIFSRRGFMLGLKVFGVLILLFGILIVSLFAYYRGELEAIRPEELAKRVQTTVTKYYDRSGNLLWEDKGDGNYKLTVKSEDISNYAKLATIAIEDRNFRNHFGIDPFGLLRAMVNNVIGGDTQGGSTLTQQLVKQVFFQDEASERSWGGVPRKIKEMILSVQVERMYNKDQIIALYLNESPYGGRRNGIESGAQTYFGKSAKDLTIAEAALLAGIPNQPALYNPYNQAGHQALIERQHKVLHAMLEEKYINNKEYKEALAYPILDNIKPLIDTKENIKAPHFVLEVRKQLEKELGQATVGQGGLSVTTTLDSRAQEAAEKAIADGSQYIAKYGADNLALSSIDVNTGNVIAMVGSVDYTRPGYGQRNSATSPLEPGSSIKPIADFAPLFKQRSGVNYGPGSILSDENIDKIYCAGTTGDCAVRNFTKRFYGNVPIRKSLAGSLNIPAIKAMHINGVEDSIKTAQDLGDKSYCINNENAGLSAAIGGGCTVRQIEHTNAFASLARGGVYKPISYVLEVKNSTGEVLKKWEKDKGDKQVLDPQSAYMVTDILKDANARSFVFGAQAHDYGFVVPGVTTAAKTGTTDNGHDEAKDSWFMSYSPVVATGVWMGNHNGAALASSSHNVVRLVTNEYMQAVHKNAYQPDGKWTPNQDFARPAGIKTLTVNGVTDIFPSWYDQKAGKTEQQLTFDKVSKKLATECTPDGAKEEVSVYISTDPVTKKEIFVAPNGYNATEKDNIHKCDDAKPSVESISISKLSGDDYQISIRVNQGTHQLSNIKVSIDGNQVADTSIGGSGNFTVNSKISGTQNITVRLQDSAFYITEASKSVTAENKPGGRNQNSDGNDNNS